MYAEDELAQEMTAARVWLRLGWTGSENVLEVMDQVGHAMKSKVEMNHTFYLDL
jgi:hypothetical protein